MADFNEDNIPQHDMMNSAKESALVSWVVDHVTSSQDERDQEWKDAWDRYYRAWRGRPNEMDKHRESELSNLVHPQTAVAIDSTRIEVASATTARADWFDMRNKGQDDPMVIMETRNNLKEDFHKAGVKKSLNGILQLGVMMGTGFGKTEVDVIDEARIVRGLDGLPALGTSRRPLVKLKPYTPQKVVLVGNAEELSDNLGVAFYDTTLIHNVHEMQSRGLYLDKQVVGGDDNYDTDIDGEENNNSVDGDTVELIEYWGLVPRGLLPDSDENDGIVDLLSEAEADSEVEIEWDENDLVEAVLVIAGKSTLLRATTNPNLLKDRMIVRFRPDVIAGQPYGRGVGEKGDNVQQALDKHLRSSQDAIDLTIHPMFGLNGQNLPKGFDFTIESGTGIIFDGSPRDSIERVPFGTTDPVALGETDRLERLSQMATGATDALQLTPMASAGGEGVNAVLSSIVKRSQDAIVAFSEDVIVPFVGLAHRLYMQYFPERYPVVDVTYEITSTQGAMARELESHNMQQLMKTESEGVNRLLLMRDIYESSSLPNREENIQIVNKQIEEAMQPKQPSPLEQAQVAQIENDMKIANINAYTNFIISQAELAKAGIKQQQADTQEAKTQAEIMNELAEAEARAPGDQMQQYKQLMELLVQSNQLDPSNRIAHAPINQAGVAGASAVSKILGDPGVGNTGPLS